MLRVNSRLETQGDSDQTGQEAKSALTWQRRKFSDRRRHQGRRNHGAARRSAAREAGTGRRASFAQWSDGNQGDNAEEEGRRADVGFSQRATVAGAGKCGRRADVRFPQRAAVARAGKFWGERADVWVAQRVTSANASAADAGGPCASPPDGSPTFSHRDSKSRISKCA